MFDSADAPLLAAIPSAHNLNTGIQAWLGACIAVSGLLTSAAIAENLRAAGHAANTGRLVMIGGSALTGIAISSWSQRVQATGNRESKMAR